MDLNVEFDNIWPLILGIVVLLFCMAYLWELMKSHKRRRALDVDLATIEGFGPQDGPYPSLAAQGEGFANPGEGGVDERQDAACYDIFYSKVYDSLVQPGARAGAEVQAPIDWMKSQGRDVATLRIADIGCGTGLHVDVFRQLGVHSVVGYDKSTHMIAEAKRKYPKSADFYRVGDATEATMMPAEQTDLITMYYFTIYLEAKRTEMLKNAFLWLAPGGVLCVHIVNKLKFDPILESASPFVGFSVQKYADERVTKSQVTFEEFEYHGDFQLHGSRAAYVEDFTFQDGRKRHQEQRVWMPTIEAMVKEIEDVGFKLETHVDLTAIGYEYQYLFLFTR